MSAEERRRSRRAAGATIDAIWHIERIDFAYHSSTVRYECGALQRRIAEILHAVGAHARIGVELTCVSGDMVRHAGAHLTLAVPVEATAENVAAATDYDTRDELIARLRQEQLPSANDIERFPASWRTVALTRNPPLSLGPDRLRPAARHARSGVSALARARRIERHELRRRLRYAHPAPEST